MRTTTFVVYLATALASAGLMACGDNLPGNGSPSLSDSNVTTPEDTPITIPVNAEDPNGDSLEISFEAADHGTVTMSGDVLTYRPDTDYNGPDSILVTVSDGTASDSATVSITVTPINDAPVAGDDTLAANEDTAATVTGAALVANDTDVEDDALTVVSVGNPSMGTVGLVGDTITYTPASNFTGTATFEYTVSDGAANDVGTVTVTVGGANDPPVGVTDTATTAEDTAATITTASLVANDTDAENQTLSVTGVSNPVNGTVSLSGGNVTFTPTLNFSGAASFDYTVSDGAATGTGHVNVTVTPVNDTPVANAQSVMVNEDGTVTITLTGSDIENSNLTFTIVTQPTAGTLGTITPVDATSATVVYTPTANSSVDDSFTFRVRDGAIDSAPATVMIDVVPQNDGPVANATTAMVNEDGSVTINLSGSDPDGDTLTFATVTGPATGTLGTYTLLTATTATVVYTPNANSSVDDSFTFRVNDGTASSAPATVTIDVVPQNDGPTANGQSVTTDEDTAVDITVVGADLDGDTLTFATGTAPQHGTLSAYTSLTATTARVTYTPTGNYNGPDSFTFTASDASATSTAATVSITVNATDDAPVAMPGATTVAEDDNVTITLVGSDADGQPLTFTVVTGPTHGSLGTITQTSPTTADVVYTGSPNNDVDDSFTFRVTAGGVDSAPATITIDVTPVNDNPVAVADNDSTQKDTNLIRAASFYSGNDTDIDGPGPLVITAVSNPLNGNVNLSAGSITFAPSPGFIGTGGFDYTLSDSGSGTATGHVTVTIIETNTPVSATDDTDSTNEDTDMVRLATAYTANDVDPDPQTLTITQVHNFSNGTATFDGTTITFTPTPGYNGPASFQYTVTDGIAFDVGQVNITVNPIDDLPVANNDGAIVLEDGNVNTNVLLNDTGLDDGGLVVTIATQGTSGTAAVQGDNTITYTPNANYVGPDSYSYTVTDGDGDASTAVVAVAVMPTNDPPVADNQSQSMNENTVLTVTLTGSDPLDVPPQPLTFAIASPPSHGALGTVMPTSPTTATVTYTPTANYVGPDSFTFTANDGLTSAPATVSITINNVAVCNDGVIDPPETCDDQGNLGGDGCSPGCQEEPGWDCVGAPSNCDPICGDNLLIAGFEQCEDGNLIDSDGCTSKCVLGAVCTAAIFAGGDRFATNPDDGHCYVSYDTEQTTFADAQTACAAVTGHLASITSAPEQTIAASVQNTAEQPWIGLADEIVEGSFGWVTGEPLGFTNWDTSQPDGANNDAEDCVNLNSTGPGTTVGRWNDTNCTLIGFTDGRICEIESNPCGNGTINASVGEMCDDGGRVNGDGCSSTCQTEPPGRLVFTEVDYDQVTGDNNEFLEIMNVGGQPVTLAGFSLVFINGSTDIEYFLTGRSTRVLLGEATNAAGTVVATLAPGQRLVVGTSNASLVINAGALRIRTGAANNIQNGEGSSFLAAGGDAFGILNIATNQLVDALSYEGNITAGNIGGGVLRDFTEGSGAGLNLFAAPSPNEMTDATSGAFDAGNNTSAGALVRVFAGPIVSDTNNPNTDWTTSALATPGS